MAYISEDMIAKMCTSIITFVGAAHNPIGLSHLLCAELRLNPGAHFAHIEAASEVQLEPDFATP